jgi:hypothetical protein
MQHHGLVLDELLRSARASHLAVRADERVALQRGAPVQHLHY